MFANSNWALLSKDDNIGEIKIGTIAEINTCKTTNAIIVNPNANEKFLYLEISNLYSCSSLILLSTLNFLLSFIFLLL